ncbi:hypothetical protein [Saccharothrix sp. Mg75]|uniref:hypothetical protein n=1 Tax=Saccharothrix sp. Mg75 TaxID=3445357 RepID=UPI003EEB8210
MTRERDPGRTAVAALGFTALALLLVSLVLSGVAAMSGAGGLGTWRNVTGAVGGVMLMMWGVAFTFGSRRDKAG